MPLKDFFHCLILELENIVAMPIMTRKEKLTGLSSTDKTKRDQSSTQCNMKHKPKRNG